MSSHPSDHAPISINFAFSHEHTNFSTICQRAELLCEHAVLDSIVRSGCKKPVRYHQINKETFANELNLTAVPSNMDNVSVDKLATDLSQILYNCAKKCKMPTAPKYKCWYWT